MQMGLQIIAKHNGPMNETPRCYAGEDEEGVAGRDCGGLLLRK